MVLIKYVVSPNPLDKHDFSKIHSTFMSELVHVLCLEIKIYLLSQAWNYVYFIHIDHLLYFWLIISCISYQVSYIIYEHVLYVH